MINLIDIGTAIVYIWLKKLMKTNETMELLAIKSSQDLLTSFHLEVSIRTVRSLSVLFLRKDQ